MQFDHAIDMPDAFQSSDIAITLGGELARYNLRLKATDVAAIKKTTALKLPARINSTSSTKDISIAKLGPDEWMVSANIKQKSKLEKSLAKISKQYICSVTDISHRNIVFELTGPTAAQFVNVGCPLDLSLETFPVGKATRTVFESAAIILTRTGEQSFQIECWRSFGPYLRDFFVRIVAHYDTKT